VAALASGADATSTLAVTEVPGVVSVGAVTTSSRTGIEDGKVVARARTEVAGVSILFGLVELHDVVTDLVAATDGTTGATAGTTTVGRATVLGQAARLGPDGLELVGSPTPLGLGSLLAPLLTGTGLHVSVAPIQVARRGASATAEAAGLEIGLDFDGSGDNVLAQVLALLPSDQLPGSGIPGVPLNTSPQALVNLLKETHVVRVTIGPARVRADASPLAPGTEVDHPATLPEVGGDGLGAPDEAGFTTPLPALPTRPAAHVGSRAAGGLVPGRAVGAALVLLALLSLPAWGLASGRLLDASLADPAPGCEATDRPTSAGGARGRRRPGR
jgi:hypothetical protein